MWVLIVIIILVLLMILVLKMTKYHITWYWCQNIRDNIVGKKSKKWRARTSPHPFRAMPERNRFFFCEVFPYSYKRHTNFRFSIFSLPPLLDDQLYHPVSLPVILLVHHHLNDHYCPNNIHILSQTWSQTPSPTFLATSLSSFGISFSTCTAV